jgi:hypothetical protein
VRPPFDAPQADRLDLVRRVVEAVRAGAKTSSEIAAAAQVARRYADYALQAARLLELISDDVSGEPTLLALGEKLTTSQRSSAAERAIFREAFTSSQAFVDFADVLVGREVPSKTALADRLLHSHAVALSTALRRATTLLSWRRYLVPQETGPQLRFAALDWSNEPDFLPPLPNPVSTQQAGLTAAPPLPAESSESDIADVPSMEPAHQPEPLPDTIASPTQEMSVSLGNVSMGTVEPNTVGEPADPSIRSNDLAYLRRQIETGSLILLTGAGFSLGARDIQGRPLPNGAEFARELWRLCYSNEEFDSSTLQDVFEQAHRRHRTELDESLRKRFSVDSGSLPDWYRTWFSIPWWKIYTLNVDDLEAAADRRFSLPRSLTSASAASGVVMPMSGNGTHVVHLNGMASDGADKVTFSTDQFAKRASGPEPIYAQLAAEILTRPFVFVGSPLDEPLFWQHIALRGIRDSDSQNELRPKGFLVSPKLPRARIDKLRAFNIVWIEATAEQFATQVLSGLEGVASRGHVALNAVRSANSGDESNIVDVATAVLETGRKTAFLLGEEASWSDIRVGRPVDREEDAARLQRLRQHVTGTRSPTTPVTVSAILATAGAGKTTFLKRAAVQFHADGLSVAWVGADAEVAPRALVRYFRTGGRAPILVIDDAGRYGTQLIPMIRDLVKEDGLKLILVALRSYHEHLLDAADDALAIEKHQIGRLTDADIDKLLEALEREKLLGQLRGMNLTQRHAAFRDRADRQILVAMIEATSGERFEDKIVAEWQGQDDVARYVYALIALATEEGLPLSRDEVLLACSGGPRQLDALKLLHKAHLLSEDENHCFRVRHRVIAEMLVRELADRGTQIEQLVIGLSQALAIKSATDEPRGSRRRRVLKHLLNHDRLLRLLRDVEPARNVYSKLAGHLDGDHHFWLQRGCLELESGDIRFAQNYLHQAAALNSGDPLVETAMAHMQLRKAVLSPASPDAEELASSAFDTLRRLVDLRGATDYHPAHIFGSQVLAWCRQAAITPRQRRSLLREAKEMVARAAGFHRSRVELRQLLSDLTMEELRPQ